MTPPTPTCWPYPPKPHLCGAHALPLDGGRCALGVPEPAPVPQDTLVEVEPTPVPGPGQPGLVEPPAVEPETRPVQRRQCTFCLRIHVGAAERLQREAHRGEPRVAVRHRADVRNVGSRTPVRGSVLTTRADLNCFDFRCFLIVGLPNRWVTDCFALCCSSAAPRGAERLEPLG